MNRISRRSFLKQGAAATASAALLTAIPEQVHATSLAKATGIQLYTVGKELAADLQGTLAKIAAIGYRTVESAGVAGKSAAEFRKALNDAGLRCPSSHIFPSPGQTPQDYFAIAKTLGSEYIVSSVMIKPDANIKSVDDYIRLIGALTQDDFKKMAAEANHIGQKAKEAGLQYAYHNHNFEFKDYGGQTGYDLLLKETDPELVKLELDCGWMSVGGQDPVAYFKKNPNRYRLMHAKDFVALKPSSNSLDPAKRPAITEVGSGKIGWPAIVAAARAAGVEFYYVDHDPPFAGKSAFEAAKIDFDYLQPILG